MRAERVDVSQMMKDLNKKAEELKVLHKTLSTIKEYGANFDLPTLADLIGSNEVKPLEVNIKPDTFYGMSQTDATEKYLRMVGHAASIDEIYAALASGGIEFSANGRNNLNMMLIRATRRFARIPGLVNSFGMLEWYPKRKRNQDLTVKDMLESEEKDAETSANKEE